MGKEFGARALRSAAAKSRASQGHDQFETSVAPYEIDNHTAGGNDGGPQFLVRQKDEALGFLETVPFMRLLRSQAKTGAPSAYAADENAKGSLDTLVVNRQALKLFLRLLRNLDHDLPFVSLAQLRKIA